MKLNPVEYLIKVFGGVRPASRAIGRSPSAISKWQTYENKDGSRGLIPSGLHKKILAEAKDKGLDITADDLINGRNIK